MRVIILPEVYDYFEHLMEILYQEEYFGFRSSARDYVTELLEEINLHLPTRLHKPAPPHFSRYGKGMWYAAFRRNRATTWYAFFTRYDDGGNTVYLVRHIANNHTAAQFI
jgi:hypothetical protein